MISPFPFSHLEHSTAYLPTNILNRLCPLFCVHLYELHEALITKKSILYVSSQLQVLLWNQYNINTFDQDYSLHH